MDPSAPSSRSWSIYGRLEITQRYEILERIGSGAYADVYRGRRRSDGIVVALKEIHDYQSSFREIEALQTLRDSPNVVDLLEYFWQEDEDAVLVLEFLPTDLASVIRDAKRGPGLAAGEVKQWMLQILRGVDACHRNSVVHRDLKPSNLLISAEGVLKLADFGQSRILQETRYISRDNRPHEPGSENEAWIPQQPAIVGEGNQPWPDVPENPTSLQPRPINEDEYLRELDGLKAKYAMEDTDKEMSLQDGDASCLATCSTGDVEDDPFKGSYTYEVEEVQEDDESGALTSCVGTRWFRAPELLYGSTTYGLEIDLWSLGCIFAELLSLAPLFPGTSDIDQLGKIISVLGDLTEETWPGCSKLPDYNKIFFNKIENPIGLEACLQNRSAAEVNIVRRLLCYNPASRASAMELLQDRYFAEEPLPVPISELKVPSTKDGHDESSPEEWADYRDLGSDSDLDEFGSVDVTTTEKGFSIRFA
ncbi:cyclin-dependent kinase F-1 [Elaeis guineensis]|uniref:Cyclin-dependent kinase F-1 n=1 Tax=Elaeis guineensis var. tenera TaxID=51953 RepID=A0A6I9QVH2_ELAGV|nr:cyclin-dependent kinase F-1 [Elaeis guineensis]